MANLFPFIGPKKRRARAHTDDDRVLLAREGEAAHADGGEFFDLDGLHTVDIALDIRRAYARERDVADVGELQMMRGKEIAHRAVERGERIVSLDAQHVDDREVGGKTDDLCARTADVNA